MEFPRVTTGRRNNLRFNYKPRYYREEKEDLDYRVNRAKREMGEISGTDGFKERIRIGYRHGNAGSSAPINKSKTMIKVRIMTYIVILGLGFYLFFYTNVLELVFEAFYK